MSYVSASPSLYWGYSLGALLVVTRPHENGTSFETLLGLLGVYIYIYSSCNQFESCHLEAGARLYIYIYSHIYVVVSCATKTARKSATISWRAEDGAEGGAES